MRVAGFGLFFGLMVLFVGCQAVQEDNADKGNTNAPSTLGGSFQSDAAVDQERLQVLGKALGSDTWPAPPELFVGPPVGRHLLAEPGSVTHELKVCDVVRFGDLPWGRCEWTWRRMGGGAGSEKPSDSTLEGELDVIVALTPSARAAQEYLLVSMADNMLPLEMLATSWSTSSAPEGIGDVAFHVVSRRGDDVRLKFTRGNVAVELRGNGVFAEETQRLARLIDAQITDQRPLTPDELLAKRPNVEVHPGEYDRGEIPFSVAGLQGRKVVVARASADGRQVSAADGRVLLGDLEGAVSTEVVVITEDLLAGSYKGDMTVD